MEDDTKQKLERERARVRSEIVDRLYKVVESLGHNTIADFKFLQKNLKEKPAAAADFYSHEFIRFAASCIRDNKQAEDEFYKALDSLLPPPQPGYQTTSQIFKNEIYTRGSYMNYPLSLHVQDHFGLFHDFIDKLKRELSPEHPLQAYTPAMDFRVALKIGLNGSHYDSVSTEFEPQVRIVLEKASHVALEYFLATHDDKTVGFQNFAMYSKIVEFCNGLVIGKLAEAGGSSVKKPEYGHFNIHFSSLLDAVIATDALGVDKPINVESFKSEGIALVQERSSRKALLAKHKELGNDIEKFKDWAKNILQPNLLAIADKVGANQLKAQIERTDFELELQSALTPTK